MLSILTLFGLGILISFVKCKLNTKGTSTNTTYCYFILKNHFIQFRNLTNLIII